MLHLKFKDIHLSIPITAYDIEFGDYVTASVEHDKIKSMTDEKDEHGVLIEREMSEKELIRNNDMQIAAMVTFCDILLGKHVSEVCTVADLVPIHLHGDLLKDFDIIGFSFSINANEEDVSLLRLYSHLLNILNNYEQTVSKNFKIGDRFAIHHEGQKYILGSSEIVDSQRLTVNEVIENNEVMRIARIAEENGNDTDRNYYFSAIVNQCAVLCRLDGESLPIVPILRERFLAKRRELFSRLSFAVVKDIDFFLTSIMVNLLNLEQMFTTATAHPSTVGKKAKKAKQQKRDLER